MSNRYHTAFWNVENLFAPENYRDRELRIVVAVQEDLQGWTEALFERKLAQLASIIAQMNGGQGPDLLGLCEVENRYVLDELLKVLLTKLPERRYGVVHADSSKDQRGIDTAFIYDVQRFSVKDVFDRTVLRRTGTREITQATFVTRSGSELIAMVNHWPSRSGDQEKSIGYRAIAGETVGWWHERIRDFKGADVGKRLGNPP